MSDEAPTENHGRYAPAHPIRLCGSAPILALRAGEVYTIFRSYRGVFAVNKAEHRSHHEPYPFGRTPRSSSSGHEHVRSEVGLCSLDAQVTGPLVRHRQQPADASGNGVLG